MKPSQVEVMFRTINFHIKRKYQLNRTGSAINSEHMDQINVSDNQFSCTLLKYLLSYLSDHQVTHHCSNTGAFICAASLRMPSVSHVKGLIQLKGNGAKRGMLTKVYTTVWCNTGI